MEKPHPSTNTEGSKPCVTKCRRLGWGATPPRSPVTGLTRVSSSSQGRPPAQPTSFLLLFTSFLGVLGRGAWPWPWRLAAGLCAATWPRGLGLALRPCCRLALPQSINQSKFLTKPHRARTRISHIQAPSTRAAAAAGFKFEAKIKKSSAAPRSPVQPTLSTSVF